MYSLNCIHQPILELTNKLKTPKLVFLVLPICDLNRSTIMGASPVDQLEVEWRFGNGNPNGSLAQVRRSIDVTVPVIICTRVVC
jgi:hypothetical protein